MKVTNFTRHLVPALGLACALGLAQAANAQMNPMSTMAQAATAPVSAATSSVKDAASNAVSDTTSNVTAAATGTVSNATGAVADKATSAMKAGTAKLAKAGEFKSEAEAAAHCPNDTVVWSSLTKSKSFHTSDSKMFGKTKHGAYVCKADAVAAGLHQAKN
jgi:hypothetical protein